MVGDPQDGYTPPPFTSLLYTVEQYDNLWAVWEYQNHWMIAQCPTEREARLVAEAMTEHARLWPSRHQEAIDAAGADWAKTL